MDYSISLEEAYVVDLVHGIGREETIFFHPSCCTYKPGLELLPFDRVVFVRNRSLSTRAYGKCLFLKADNNFALGLLAARGCRVSALGVVCDGCVEGGNYECVMGRSFFGRFLSVMADEAFLSFDHGWIPRGLPIEVIPMGVDELKTPMTRGAYWDLLNRESYQLRRTARVVMEGIVGKIRVAVEHESIWRGIEPRDMFLFAPFEEFYRGYFEFVRGLIAGGFDRSHLHLAEVRPITSIADCLRTADSKGIERILIGPVAGGAYGGIVNEIRNHEGEFPKEVIYRSLMGEYPGAFRGILKYN
jgi:hypothetical protein